MSENDNVLSSPETQPSPLKDSLINGLNQNLDLINVSLGDVYSEANRKAPNAFNESNSRDWWEFRMLGENVIGLGIRAQDLVNREKSLKVAREALQHQSDEVVDLFFGEDMAVEHSLESRMVEHGRIFTGEDRILVSKGEESGITALLCRRTTEKKIFPGAVILKAYANPDKYTHVELQNGDQIIQIKPKA